MPIPQRLEQHVKTAKQLAFPKDFLEGWESYERWDQASVGQTAIGQRTFRIAQEDVVAYNQACGETDPLMIDPAYAAAHSPTGEVLQHPIFVTTIAFYSLGEEGVGTWIRTPGARNPYQRIEIVEPFRNDETITTTVTTDAKYLQRGNAYLRMKLDFHNEQGALRARWFCSLILPRSREAVARFANALGKGSLT